MKNHIHTITIIFILSAVIFSLYSQLPKVVDNRNQFLIKPFEHRGHPCAFASSLAYGFTYEINCIRNTPAQGDDHIYPYIYGYHFHNKGTQNANCADLFQGLNLAVATGIATSSAFGGFIEGFPSKWVNGYDKYYKAMKDRSKSWGSFDCSNPDGMKALKQWLYDHGKGDKYGGVGFFSFDCLGVKSHKISTGPEIGKTIITQFGTMFLSHNMTVVGYNDDIEYDLNQDGQITTDIDINRDGKIDLQDQEKGAFLVLDSHIKYDGGFAYCAYSVFSRPFKQGGIANDNQVYHHNVYKDYQPKFTLRATITHNQRDKIKIYAGIAKDPKAKKPDKVKYFAGAFNYAGGSNPMEGKKMSETIEIGLDASDLVDSINGDGAFFLCIDSKSGGSGKVDKLSLLDYTDGSTPKVFPYKEENVTITGKLNLGGIVANTPIQEKSTVPSKSGFYLHSHSLIGHQKISLTITDRNIQGMQILLYNLHGILVKQKTIAPGHSSSLDIPTTSLAGGIYKMVIIAEKANKQPIMWHRKAYIIK